MPELDPELFEALRTSCKPAHWSRGLELARAGVVSEGARRDDELEFRIALPGKILAPVVSLFPEDEDWSCTCTSREDVCAHVAAAAIAIRQGLLQQGEEAAGRLSYRLDGRSGTLSLHRVIVQGEREEFLRRGLHARLAARGGRPGFTASQSDLAFEAKAGDFHGGPIPRARMPQILAALAEVEGLELDGRAVGISGPSSGLCLRISDHPDGFLARLEQDPDISEIFENGALRLGRRIAALGGHGLDERSFTRLRRGERFGWDDVGQLVGSLIPRLRQEGRVRVLIDAAELPGASSLRPHLQIDCRRKGMDLEILAQVVYGRPPVARVDGKRLVLLTEEGDVPTRMLRAEAQLAQILRKEIGVDLGRRERLGPSAALRLAAALAADGAFAQAGAKFELVGDKLDDFVAVGGLDLRLNFEEDGAFEMYFEAGADSEEDERGAGGGNHRPGLGQGGGRMRASAAAVVEAWQRGESFAPLLDGGFGRIPHDFLARYGHLVGDLIAAREAAREDGSAPASTAQALNLVALAEALDQVPPPAFTALRQRIADAGEGDALGELVRPEDLDAELRGYQEHGLAWLQFMQRNELGALLADDMGLGKTLQALAALQGRSLVVAPTSVLWNWKSEAERFRPGLKVSIYHGPKRELDPEADLTLTSYALLRLDQLKLNEREWDCVVLDEAQTIKNPSSKVAQAAYALPARWRIALTGTPVENRLDDLWSQFHFLNRGFLGGRSDFETRYAKAIAAGDDAAAAHLRTRLRPFVLRRLKSEVATELPKRTDLVLHCELDEGERALYDAVRAAAQDDVVKRLSAGQNTFAALEALLRLRQAACHSALLPGQAGRHESSAKLRVLGDKLATLTAAGHKCLVFSQWTALLDLCQPILEGLGMEYLRLDGSTTKRGEVVAKFQDEQGPPILLISLKAGGTGLNLTQADHVFLLDPWWNPAVEDQAADRAHRIGQDRPVFVHRLVARETVEERILALQAKKRALAAAAIDGGAAGGISRDELLALLS